MIPVLAVGANKVNVVTLIEVDVSATVPLDGQLTDGRFFTSPANANEGTNDANENSSRSVIAVFMRSSIILTDPAGNLACG